MRYTIDKMLHYLFNNYKGLMASFAILNPKGIIALQERDLMLTAVALMALVVIPVFILTALFAYRYRSSNTKARYTPNVERNAIEEFVWWAVPSVIVIILAGITWTSSHTLDPYRPIISDVKPITVQVVALDWKWLFIYPEYGIASVNLLEFPVGTPINLQITADAPMNSLWIPSLAGQIYAMAGMVTQLHLYTDIVGEYPGRSSNFSGRGFSGMLFTARAVDIGTFNNWISSVKMNATTSLSHDSYTELIKPTTDNPISYYGTIDGGLYTAVVNSFMTMGPPHTNPAPVSMPHIQM